MATWIIRNVNGHQYGDETYPSKAHAQKSLHNFWRGKKVNLGAWSFEQITASTPLANLHETGRRAKIAA